MALVPPLVLFWAAYGSIIITSLVGMAISMGLNLALAYLNKAKTHKSIFDSSTYHENGMINNIQPGTPKNIVYGEHRIPPTIINKYSYAASNEHGDHNHTKTEVLCSLGEETTGIWGIRLNDQSISSAYQNGKGLSMWWAPGGRTNQLIYEYRNRKKGSLTGAISPGYNVTINFDYDGGNNKHPFQGNSNNEESPTVTATKPGYVLIYKDGTKGHYEMVRYEGIQANGGEWQLTGCRVTKSHTSGSTIQQDWQLDYKDDDTTPLTIMPPFGKTVTEQQDLNAGSGTLIDYDAGWCPAITTNNKIRNFAVTVGWEKGLYGIDKTSGYEKKSCRYQIRWKKTVGGSYTTDYNWTDKTLHDTTDSGLKLIIDKNAKYAYVVNADGTYYTDFEANIATNGLKFKESSGLKKYRRWKLKFTTHKEGASHDWVLPKEEGKSIEIINEPTGEQMEYDIATDSFAYKYRVKIKFDTSKEKYTGPTRDTTNPVSFQITYQKGTATNLFEGIASPSNAVTASYRLTHHLPGKEPLDYAKYDIQVKKLDTDVDDLEKGQNELRWMTLQEMDNDAMELPYESLLGMRLKMNEKINTTIESITCMVQGKAVVDVQEASNVWAASTAMSVGQFRRPTVWDNMLYRVRSVTGNAQTGSSEPTWLDIGTITDNNVTWEIANRYSSNPLDISADIIMSKRYGRGKYLELTNDRITAFYDKLDPEAAFADEVITENSTARKRFQLNFNLDFRGPLIDLLQSIGNTFRGKFYFDGEIPVCYIDRKKTPTAMFCMGNIVEDSYKPEALNLSDNINRLQAQFLNSEKSYTQDTDQADIISVDSSFTVSRLQDKIIALYGLTKKWYARKILNYMLRFAWYTRNSVSFQTTLDGISCDIGDTFYCHDDTMNLTAQSGRIIAVGSNYIDMDKAFTFVIATTYKALLRQNTGVPQVELTVDLAATGTGVQTRVYFTQAVLNTVEANSIYILGTGTYYMTFRCVQRAFRGNVIEIGALEYVEEAYRIYKNDTSDPAWTGDTDETLNEKDTALPSNIVPPEIPDMVLVESRSTFGEIEVHLRPPVGNLEWHHADVYYQEEGNSDWTYARQTKGEAIKVSGLRIGKEYDFKAISISPSGIANNNETTATITLTGDADIFKPNPVSGIQLIGNKGSVLNVSGSDFEFKWNKDSKLSGDDSTNNYIKHAGLSNIYENLRYRIAVYFPDIPTTVKHGAVMVKDKLVHEEIVTENHYRFRLAQNIEAAKDLWESYSTHASYATYYGKPNRICRFVLQVINGYGNVSVESEITLTNPAPDMNDSAGTNTAPILKALKSGVRVKFIHPYQEYDISHFMVQYAENSGFTTNLKKIRVSSAITVNSTDDELDSTQYKVEVDGLDPKKTYYFRIRPHDTYGAGTFSATSSIAPGVSDDDANDDIVVPAQVTGVVLATNSNNNVVVQWSKPAGTDATDVIEVIIDWRASQFTGTPTQTLTSAGGNIPTLSEVDQGYLNSDNTKLVIGEKRVVKLNTDETESHTKNSIIIKGAKVGYTYEARVRFRNSSGKDGAWSAWAYNATAVTGLSSDDFDYDFKKFIFTGTFSASDIDTVAWSTGALQFKNTNGSTTDYTISNAGNTGNMTEAMWIVWPGDAPNANTKFKALTSAQYLAATGKTPMAFAQKGDTGQVAFFSRFSDKKDFAINSSFVSAGSIITAHLAALSVEASKMNINGTLTMGHSSGAKMLFQDNSSVNRIKIAATNGGSPKLIVTKATYDADTETNPDNMLFSTDYNYFKIVDDGVISTTSFIQENVAANSIVTQNAYDSTTISDLKSIQAILYIATGSTIATPLNYTEVLLLNSNGIVWLTVDISHIPGNAEASRIKVVRNIYNNSSVAYNNANMDWTGMKVKWALMAETIS